MIDEEAIEAEAGATREIWARALEEMAENEPETIETSAVVKQQQVEEVPDEAEHLGPDEEPPAGATVVIGPRGGRYVIDEPTADRPDEDRDEERPDDGIDDEPDLVEDIGVEASGILQEAGFDGFIVGGTVRDRFMGMEAYDLDMASDAHPEEIAEVFDAAGHEVVDIEEELGTVTAIVDGEEVEVTTYRVEDEYGDARRPDELAFVDDLEDDLERRDLTWNAMAYDPVNDELADPFGGQEDLEAGIVDTVGDPVVRFEEDGLRPFRAMRFRAKFDFEYEDETGAALAEETVHDSVEQVSAERVQSETDKALRTDHPDNYLRDFIETGIADRVWPELAELAEVDHPERDRSLAEHGMAVARETPPNREVRLAAMFNQSGYAETDDPDDAQAASASVVEDALERLNYPGETIDMVETLVENGGAPIEPGMDDADLRRVVDRVGRENFDELVELRAAEMRVAGREEAEEVDEVVDRYDELEAEGEGVPDELAIDGGDVIGLGLDPGPEVGAVLDELHEWVLEDPNRNNPQVLEDEAQRIIDEMDIAEMAKSWEPRTRSGVLWKQQQVEEVPDEAEHLGPDEEPPEGARVVIGPRGGRYVIDEPVDEGAEPAGDRFGDAPRPPDADVHVDASTGGLRELPEDASPEEMAAAVPDLAERFNDELDPDQELPEYDSELSDEEREAFWWYLSEQFGRMDQRLAREVASRISHIDRHQQEGSSNAGPAGMPFFEQDEEELANMQVIMMGQESKKTFKHELQHATDRSLGYFSRAGFSTGRSGFNPYRTDVVADEEAVGEDEKPIADALLEHPDDELPVGVDEWIDDVRDEVEIGDDGRPQRLDNETIGERLTADGPEDLEARYRRFVDEVNRAFVKTQEAYNQTEDRHAALEMIKMPYAMTNATEFAAVFQEVMQHEGHMNANLQKYMEHHPGLVAAYMDLFEPSPETQEEIERQYRRFDVDE